MRLVGEDGIVTVDTANINQKDEETDNNSIATEKGWRKLIFKIISRYNYSETEDQLPTSVLLQRIRVGGEKEKVGRRKGKMVRRRRRKRRKNQQQGETLEGVRDAVRGPNVYFTPL